MSASTTDTGASTAFLKQLDVADIERNDDNPRIVFRQAEFDDLVDSIFRYGVQVPISVYKKGAKYILIDGERRWRSCRKLNKKTVPALIQEEPTRLKNLLLMFNIHGLREQWDLLTIALKLGDLIRLLEEDLGKTPTEGEISERAGLPRAIIRRCKLLLELPKKYHNLILTELHKPKSKQKLTEDFFIEMERALKVVEKTMPDLVEDKESIRKTLISKYRSNVIDNRVHFRDIAKIARAENVDADINIARSSLRKLFDENDYSISDAFDDSVADAYEERDILSRVNSVTVKLRGIDPATIDEETEAALRELVDAATTLLEA